MQTMTEKEIKIAAKFYKCRDTAKAFYRDEYPEKLNRTIKAMKTQTQDQQVLEWILTGTPISQYDANYKLKPAVSRLAAIILRLEKQRGWRGFIRHEDVVIKNESGISTCITRYRL
jgi:hypothetical protein